MRKIKKITFCVICLINCLQTAVAQEETAKDNFYQAYSEIANMLNTSRHFGLRSILSLRILQLLSEHT